MKYAFIFLSVFLLFIGCQDQAADVDASAESPTKVQQPAAAKSVQVRDTFDCEIYGKRDKTSDHWFPELELYFAMTNDIFQDVQPTTNSYNVFQVYNTLNCNLIYNSKLPPVDKLERPYVLHTDIYEPINQLVCAQSPEKVNCYSVRRKEMLIPLSAPIASLKAGTYDPKLARDLFVWEHFLFGWTDKIGAYVFDMTTLQNPSTIRPAGTYSTADNTDYLFFLSLPTGNQLLVSEVTNGKLTMHPILSKPMNLKRRVIRDQSGGRFAAFMTKEGGDFVAVDLAERKEILLPKNAKESTLTLKSYLKSLN